MVYFSKVFSFFANVYLIFFFASLISCNSQTHHYPDPVLEDYFIYCNEDSLQYIYTNYTDNIYIPIKIVIKEDTLIGKMRVRGDTSRKDPKKSLKIKCKFKGVKKVFNFNAEYSDKSFIREYLSSQIMNASGQYCFNSNFAKLHINNKFIGLYLKIENIDDDFLARNILSEKGNLYKATKDGACMSIFDDLSKHWEKKNHTKKNWDDLKELINNVNTVSDTNFYAFVNENFNYSNLINLLALNIYLANGSTYYHNYYLYHHPEGKWELIPWDMDKSLSYYDWMPYQYHRTSSEWESDNPLVERAFLNKKIMADIRHRLEELHNSILAPNAINPLIDRLEKLLENSIKQDITDQIKNTKEWKDFLGKEKTFFKTRFETLQQQFNSWPSTFAVNRINQPVCDEILFEWTSSKSPIGKSITYTLSVSPDFLFQDSSQIITKTTNDTSYLFTDNIPKGKYYWKVTATDGEFLVEGFNSKNIIEKTNCSVLPSVITQKTILRKAHSPYHLKETLTIEKNGSLQIEEGVELRLDTGVNIMVHGNFSAKGTIENPIVFKPSQENGEWGYFYFFNTKALFDHVTIREGRINAKYTELSIKNTAIHIQNKRLVFGINRNPVIWTHHGTFLMENSVMEGNGTGEGINTNFSKSWVSNSTFNNLPDAIEYICVNEGLIENCTVKNSPDDAIDMNACHHIVVRNNMILNNSDKGISVGKEQYGHSSDIKIEHNTIIGNGLGIAVKDSSFAIIRNNRFYQNKISVSIFRKDPKSVGGIAKIEENIFYKNYATFQVDAFSKAIVGINYSDGILPIGKTKQLTHLADSLKAIYPLLK